MGGIETFFLRLARERSKQGLVTKILLLSPPKHSDPELMGEMKKVADVFFADDIFFGGRASFFLALLLPFKINLLKSLIEGVEHIHVSSGHNALLAFRIFKKLNFKGYISVGFYHSKEFPDYKSKKIPYCEIVNSRFVLEFLPKRNLLTFSQSTLEFYKKTYSIDLGEAKVFRIGVIEPCQLVYKKYTSAETIKICSIGRLVSFKTYNIWMLDVIEELNNKGITVHYDIYGTGPLSVKMKKIIEDKKISNFVNFKGQLEYRNINKVVAQYDLFVGSGTAIIESSAAGVCSIVGLESIPTPHTCGYFCEYADRDYNIADLNQHRVSVSQLISEFYEMDVYEKQQLSEMHMSVSHHIFGMKSCLDEFDSTKYQTLDFNVWKYSRLAYLLSFFYQKFVSIFFKNSYFNLKYLADK